MMSFPIVAFWHIAWLETLIDFHSCTDCPFLTDHLSYFVFWQFARPLTAESSVLWAWDFALRERYPRMCFFMRNGYTSISLVRRAPGYY